MRSRAAACIVLAVQPISFAATPTQYALAVCFLILGPAFGLTGALLQWRREQSVVLGAVLASGASWLAWLFSCGVALALFPGYPRAGPAALVAVTSTLPGLVAGAVVLKWLASRRGPTRGDARHFRAGGALLLAACGCLSFALVAGHIRLITWPARRELPPGAEVLAEHGYEDTFLGDFRYEMDARMSEADFRTWMTRLGLRATSTDELRYEMDGSSCGATGEYREGVGHFTSWCS